LHGTAACGAHGALVRTEPTCRRRSQRILRRRTCPRTEAQTGGAAAAQVRETTSFLPHVPASSRSVAGSAVAARVTATCPAAFLRALCASLRPPAAPSTADGARPRRGPVHAPSPLDSFSQGLTVPAGAATALSTARSSRGASTRRRAGRGSLCGSEEASHGLPLLVPPGGRPAPLADDATRSPPPRPGVARPGGGALRRRAPKDAGPAGRDSASQSREARASSRRSPRSVLEHRGPSRECARCDLRAARDCSGHGGGTLAQKGADR